MAKSENIACDAEAAKKLRLAVIKKYGKIKGFLGKEVAIALENRAKKLEAELEGV